MRLGGPVFAQYDDPEGWAAAVKRAGYRAAYCPVGLEADAATVRAYAEAARRHDLVIAEVGAWCNPLSKNEAERRKNLQRCQESLALAEAVGARCCVNVAGSLGEKWDGPCAGDLTEEAFDLVVASVREIVDAVKPARAYYTLEPMPWMYPDSPDSFLRLLRAVGRERFAVHLDPVNMINTPRLYFNNAAFLAECFAKLGPYIKSCHAKDLLLRDDLTVHLDEVRLGLGGLDQAAYLRGLAALEPDIPLMLEHLPGEEDYLQAAAHLRGVAAGLGMHL